MFPEGTPAGGKSTSVFVDEGLDRRIRAAYRRAVREVSDHDGSLWAVIHRMNLDTHEALKTADEGPLALRDPASSSLTYGFDNLTANIVGMLDDQTMADAWLSMFDRELRVLAQAIGVKRLTNPEGAGGYLHNEPLGSLSIAEIVDGLSAAFGSPVRFPTPFRGEFGLYVPGGLASQRSIWAVYQAWRLKQMTDHHGGRVVEIGAGLGRTAFYAVTAAALSDYTIVDLPLTNAAQASFLGRTIGPDRICLFGETHRPGQVRIMPVQWFRSTPPRCDVVLNVDSLTEMPADEANAYADWAMREAKVLLSMNHEANETPVRLLPGLAGCCTGRFPLMNRTGYVEEIYEPAGKRTIHHRRGEIARLSAHSRGPQSTWRHPAMSRSAHRLARTLAGLKVHADRPAGAVLPD